MSLIEIIIVIALIGVIMTIVIRNVTGQQDNAMKDATKIALSGLGQSLNMYRVHNFRYPTTEQGLDALLRNPGADGKWRGPYAEEKHLNDAWGNRVEYESDGTTYKLISRGTKPDDPSDDISYPESSPSGGGSN